MTEEVIEPGTLVLYHGSKRACHGLAFVDESTNAGTRLTLRPFSYIDLSERTDGNFVDGVNSGILYQVRRESFTVVQLPEIKVVLKPGVYQHEEDGKLDLYVLDDEEKWTWYNPDFHSWEARSRPVYPLDSLIRLV